VVLNGGNYYYIYPPSEEWLRLEESGNNFGFGFVHSQQNCKKSTRW
jgi:hypothetical protein